MAQLPAPGQRKPLSTARVESTIPTSADGAWVYPSDQMFYNAMRKKGYEPREEDMRTVVAIHNAGNRKNFDMYKAQLATVSLRTMDKVAFQDACDRNHNTETIRLQKGRGTF